MKLTNNLGLPAAFENFAANDKYSRGDAQVSVTTLIDSPRIAVLRSDHHQEMEVDVADRVWALMGTAVHHVLEHTNSPDTEVEERLYWPVFDWVISGAIDVQRYNPDGTMSIVDYKVCSVWSVLKEKIEWERQLNCYAYLVRKNKEVAVTSLQVCAVIRDWSRSKAKYDKSYPQSPVCMIDVRVWDTDEQDMYIEERVALHKASQGTFEFAEPLPQCTDEDRWTKPAVWAVKKEGRKSAVKLFDDERHAKMFISEEKKKGANALFIEHRQGEHTRCEGNYCGVAEFCSQYKGDDHV